MNFYEVLKKADTKDILDFRFPKYDMPIYPLVRWGILSYLNSGIDYLERKKNQRTRDIFSFSKYLLDTVIGNPFFSSQNDSIFFSSVVLDTTKKDGKYFNRIDDYFALIYQKKSLIVEDSFDRRYNKPRYYRKVRSNDYLRIKARIVSKLKTRKEKIEYESLDKLLEYCEKFILDVDKVAIQIKMQYIYYHFNGLFLEREYKKLFHKIKPKIIFVSDGHYGGFAWLIKQAHEMGIKVGEFQHGLVSKKHEAYNYGDALINSEEYKKYTPDFFLSWGNYWNEQIRIPGKKIVIGNPHFSESIKKYPNFEGEKDTILVPSQWTVTMEMVEISSYLAKEFPNYRIIFKLHPGELKNYYLIKPLEGRGNIVIIKDGDIYEYISKAEIIVACYSTTVFEAFAMKKRIFILDNQFSQMNIPEGVGDRFHTNEELKRLIIDNKTNLKPHVEYYFNPNWKENYINFLKHEVGIK